MSSRQGDRARGKTWNWSTDVDPNFIAATYRATPRGMQAGWKARAEYGPPPEDFDALTSWIRGHFDVVVTVSGRFPPRVFGLYYRTPPAMIAPDVPGIIVVSSDSPQRRWTALHELGHHLMPHTPCPLDADSGLSATFSVNFTAERHANSCAAALAIDADLLAECSAWSPARCAEVLGVPEPAVSLYRDWQHSAERIAAGA